MSELLNAVAAALTALGLALTLLGGRAWFRYGETRLGLLFFAFLGFLAQGTLMTWGLFIRERVDDLLIPLVTLSGASLLLVYVATLARPSR